MLRYLLDLIGGPYDGTRRLGIGVKGKKPPPEIIFVGKCRGECGAEPHHRPHTWWWEEWEVEKPAATVVYRFLGIDAPGSADQPGVARYVHGDLDILDWLGTWDYADERGSIPV